MKKSAVICENKILEVINNPNRQISLETKQTLTALQEGLSTCTSKVPSGGGFPFDLPAVNYCLKITMSKSFFDKVLTSLNDKAIDPTLLSYLQDFQNTLNEFTSSDIFRTMQEIELLYGFFTGLRLLLENEDFSSKEIKNDLKSYLKLLNKYQIDHPKLSVIRKRLKKYWKYLFHCYDDKRIPRTNLDIERYFNHLKRIKRRRTGVKNCPTYFSHEAKSIVQIENITNTFSEDFSESRFINEFKVKRLSVTREQLKKQSEIRVIDKSFYERQYHQKISLLKAETIFDQLADKISLC